MNAGCGCAGAGIANAPAQALLPLNASLSPLTQMRVIAAAPVGASVQVAQGGALPATPEAQEAAQAQVFAGQTGGASTPAAKKSSTSTWVVLGALAAAAAAFL